MPKKPHDDISYVSENLYLCENEMFHFKNGSLFQHDGDLIQLTHTVDKNYALRTLEP